MKKRIQHLFTGVLAIGLLAGCGNNNTGSNGAANAAANNATKAATAQQETSTAIDVLKVSFVPSKDPDQIITATEPLKELLKTQLGTKGFTVGDVQIDVGTTYEAVGEALSAGTTDVGLIPGGTYALYDDGAEVLLTSTRKALSNDSENPKDWNDNKPTTGLDDKQASYYRSLLIAGPSAKGQELAAKVNNGEELTWEDLNSATWAVMSTSSSAGYIYPTLWLQEKYQKGLTDLAKVTQSDSYGSSFARLAAGQADIVVAFADARRDNEEKWTSEYGGTGPIWDQTNVIGVTQPIYNDTVSVSKNSPIMTDELKTALQESFMEIAETPEGKEVIAIYSHEGYKVAQSSDYDGERQAQELIRSMK
ncbi:phosphate/phosphite/phosphonate ABC transporter substrate-binding protein [Paenibacillus sp. FSL R7-0331]|uniref:phosphate/phosphite/phosphonate ABC transporter substrate-binding protein n=1 Tax=Paenibacillus sp. FSL R7-0331 TaxID=1536773 RepID=UPI0004F7B3F1|nr:PhnD/SsuA/transferrin family substrate-binding protein [Paenibacillus sp. FSL R7-0331]AIQ51459.1 phosphonate ABC transporter substrate-binding protein [Paenibacillus sp. FSL R7-0331]